jgi:DNA-binding MarR family transcriptional regulator
MSTIRRPAKHTILSVTARQHEILTILRQRKHWLVSEIAETLQVSCAAATKAITRLERKGLVTRTVDPMDRRCVNVNVTRAGIELLTAPHYR